MKKRIFYCETENLDQFRRTAELAAQCNATHVWVSEVEPSIWQWHQDMNDPYPNWGIYRSTIFKIVVPDELKPFLPVDYAKRNLETIAKRAEILKEYGLRGMFLGMDPAYLPEAVYRAHPDWRGPRCDQPRRARKDYYAPCIDNPEFREIFVRSYGELCKVAPIEYFQFLTNDSGGGLCWSEGLYNGKNGPKACAHINPGDRVVSFLSAVQEGAAMAGLKAEVNVRGIRLSDKAQAIAKLKEGQSIDTIGRSGAAVTRNVGLGTLLHNPTFPIKRMPLMVNYVEMAQKACADDNANVFVFVPGAETPETSLFLQKYLGKIGQGPAARYNCLQDIASELVGSEHAWMLVSAWDAIHKAYLRVDHLDQGGHLFRLGTVHQRWLTRPFVAFPQELAEEERNFWRPFLFQAQDEAHASDMLDMQASRWVNGYHGARMLDKTLSKAHQDLSEAQALLTQLLDAVGEIAYSAYLRDLERKVRLYRCILTNAQNTASFQSIIDRTDYSTPPRDTTDIISEQGSPRLVQLNQIIRDEIGNTLEIIRILESAEGSILHVTPTEELESIQFFGPDIIEDLKKKINVMEDHRMDLKRLYMSYNR